MLEKCSDFLGKWFPILSVAGFSLFGYVFARRKDKRDERETELFELRQKELQKKLIYLDQQIQEKEIELEKLNAEKFLKIPSLDEIEKYAKKSKF